MQSQSMTGSSLIYLEMNYGVNLDEAVSSCRDKIDMVRKYLPTDSDSPVMFKMDPSMIPIMGLAIKGNRTPEELRKLSEDVIQKKLEQIDGVASAYINGGREKCIRVDIPRERLEAYKELIKHFTIAAHKEEAGQIGHFGVESGVESGEITFF